MTESDRDPTLFAWAGGLPALTRMTRIFYGRHVPDDPLLGPLFARMEADHPERVAAWLGEVFGGPPAYSERWGGYGHMIAQHLGRSLTEEQRARWVQLLTRSADEAGLPSDPEFRAAFVAYLEWGSRIALENSQPGATPPPAMPVPRWSWVNGATPSFRAAMLVGRPADMDDEAQAPTPDAPVEGEPLSFERHVKGLFRARDRSSMRRAFDLWDAGDVSAHADAILGRLREGSMPCDGAWPSDRVDLFERWVTDGKRP
jgi:truncated hemoglobin YjbI